MFASRLFTCGLRTPILAGGLAFGTTLAFSPLLQQHRHALRLDSSPSSASPKDWSFSQYQSDASVPIVKSSGDLNARAVRQLSAGSIIGLVAGLAVSTFSKSLVLLIGLLVAGVQTAESYGIHIVPYKSMQKYVKGIDLRSVVQDNVAFKISFGMMFALSAFAELPQ
ncbi:hypothetical protein CLAFUW4_06915 [Fulvia fulva]|uniref:Uncharacterized protein n=1 Tax=Passalora fulva TaxID=5499 RepID=A0A9Q8PAT1_PASFU|nr:uncharacterized protein CLAFUR5_07053 [Fulvia fulva]KAK4622228.1 hypothetical protein CLAFUR4_06924 [Fulvia fulva]KAK4622617.1 hypothetical protein CLAFUR0_06922 [Fulvia fulva]UJO19056.1 hypothetical protein CLAFUR5_07053 [Fulvia fulva]WPV16350.1 hypothetical protein CLAFUW4_06915 [Fulvia fulva]WPV31309.1 hypothetical protein CLAFUW7_06915 [Fulvia fulva]